MPADPRRLNRPADLNRSYDSPEVRYQREQTLERLAVQPGEVILDIGCGTGFLTSELAPLTGPGGRVDALDVSEDMVNAARERCAGMDHVHFHIADACNLPGAGQEYDVVTCTQVLLYVPDTPAALAEMHRACRPGGRVAIIETDWRSLVLNTEHPDVTERAIVAWDSTVPSPNLPAKLGPMLRSAGFTDLEIHPIPLINTRPEPGTFSHSTHRWLGRNAVKRGLMEQQEYEAWTADLERKITGDDYFFSLNRYLFMARRP